ncbi:MAG: hypothetical protein AAGF11_09285 [Myxococcota bacterium]
MTHGYDLAEHAGRMQHLGINRMQLTVDGPQPTHDTRRPIRVALPPSQPRDARTYTNPGGPMRYFYR